MIFFIGILIILLTTVGQVFLKLGADKAGDARLINGHVLFAYILFLITVLLSYFLMKIIDMKYFTVIMSLNYVTVVVAAKMFLSEEIKKDRIVGTILITLGVVVFLLK